MSDLWHPFSERIKNRGGTPAGELFKGRSPREHKNPDRSDKIFTENYRGDDRDSGEVIRSEFPRKKFLRQGYKERYTADDQDRDKGNLPSDPGRMQKISKKQMEKNACNGEERNVVRPRPHSKRTGSFHLKCLHGLHGSERAGLFGNNDPIRWGSLSFILNTLVPDHSHWAAPLPFRD